MHQQIGKSEQLLSIVEIEVAEMRYSKWRKQRIFQRNKLAIFIKKEKGGKSQTNEQIKFNRSLC